MSETDFKIFDARIKAPFTMIISGPPLAGKTSFVTKLIQNRDRLIDQPISYIVWFYGEETPLTKNLENKYPGLLKTFNGIPESFDPFIKKDQHGLFIFDDLMRETSTKTTITDLFSKKSHHCNISVILITQNLFYEGKERKTFMRSAHYLVIFNNPLDYSMVYSLAKNIFPRSQKVFLNIYEKAANKPNGYIFIDGNQQTIPQARFRTDIFHSFQKVFIPEKWDML